MTDRQGNAFVTDFGLARVSGNQEHLTGAGDLLGTPAYMSPEQARGGNDVDGAADIYALGAMVFEMLSGSVPYRNDNSLGVLMSHMNDEIPAVTKRNGKLPAAVDKVIRTAMAKDKTRRY